MIEYPYACVEDANGVDVCTTIYPRPVTVSSNLNSLSSKITVKFDQEMYNASVTSQDIELVMSGPNSPYTIDWSATFEKESFIITYTITPEPIGGIGESIQVTLSNIKKFNSDKMIPISSPLTFEFTFLQPEVSESTQSGGKGASYTFVLTILLSLGVSLLTGGSMELLWSLANTLQMLFFLGLLDLYYSSDLKAVYSFMEYSNFSNPLTEYLVELIRNLVGSVSAPVNTKFEDLGFDSTSIILNSFDKLLIIFFFMLCVIVITIIVHFNRKKEGRCFKLLKKIEHSIRYESISRFLVEIMLYMTVVSMINLSYGDTSKGQDIFAFIVACFVLFGVFGMILYTTVYPSYYREELIKLPELHQRHEFLYKEFKATNHKARLYYSYFLIRRLLFSFTIVSLKNFTLHQCILLTLMNSYLLIYHLRTRPFLNPLQNFLSSFNE
jgi:hypothetical protein